MHKPVCLWKNVYVYMLVANAYADRDVRRWYEVKVKVILKFSLKLRWKMTDEDVCFNYFFSLISKQKKLIIIWMVQ